MNNWRNKTLQYTEPSVIQWTVLRKIFFYKWAQMCSGFGKLMEFISPLCLQGSYIKHRLVSCKTCQNNNSIMPNRIIFPRHFTYSLPFIIANRTLPCFNYHFAEQRSLSIMSPRSISPTVTTQSLVSTEGEIHFIRMSSQCFHYHTQGQQLCCRVDWESTFVSQYIAENIFIITAK